MPRCFSIVAIVLVALLFAQAASASALRVARTAHPPVLEAYTNGGRTGTGSAVSDFRQRDPGDGLAVSHATTAYVAYDDKNLYAVFVCKDEPGKIRARLSKREAIEGDDYVVVYLDTFQDGQRAYVFAVNPLGVQRDGVLTEGQDHEDYSFDTVWTSEGRLTDDGFIVAMAIPFKSLRFPSGSVQQWRIALGRVIARNNEDAFWPHISKRHASFLQQMGVLEGLENLPAGRNMQFIPYGIIAHSSFLDRAGLAGPKFRGEDEGRYGLDSKFVIRNALTLDMAANPDFSQVESDEPQVTVNQRFEVFFPEKRPFFIENAGLFQTPVPLFFSRRIADPQFGLRLSGKFGSWAFGALAMDDQAPGKRARSDDTNFGRRTNVGVFRLIREFGHQSSIGLLMTESHFADSSNRVIALDMRFKLNRNWVLLGQAMQSYDRTLGGEQRRAPGYFAELAHDGRHFGYSTRYTDLSPDFRGNRLGFVKRVDVRQVEQKLKYRWRPKNHLLQKFGPELKALINRDRAGSVQDWELIPSFKFELNRRTEIELTQELAAERFQNTLFRRRASEVTGTTEWLKWLALTGKYRWGTDINFKPPSELAPFLGGLKELEFGCTLRASSKLRLDESYIWSRLGVLGSRHSIFNDHIFRSKLNYQFTRALSLRAILDYEGVLPNSAFSKLQREKRVTADILATYMVHPGTALYVGYTNGFENLDIDPATARLRRTGFPATSTGRQFYIKLSYLFRY